MKDNQTNERRNALRKMTGLFIGAAAAASVVAPSVQAFEKDSKIVKVAPSQNLERNPESILNKARQDFGLLNQDDITDSNLDKKRIGDDLNKTSSQHDFESQRETIRVNLFYVVSNLMNTNKYEIQAQSDMKVLYLETKDALFYTLKSLNEGYISEDTAKMDVRVSVGGYLNQLEQFSWSN